MSAAAPPTRSRGRCAGNGLRAGLRRVNPLTSAVPARRLLGRQLVLGRARLKLVELQFQLVE